MLSETIKKNICNSVLKYIQTSKLTKEYRTKLSFENLKKILKSKDVFELCQNCLTQLHEIITFYNLWEDNEILPENIIGSFLAAYIIENNYIIVFGSKKETKLLDSTKNLLNIFDQIEKLCISNHLDTDDVFKELLTLYAKSLYEYFNLFNDWKKKDKVYLTNQIQNFIKSIIIMLDIKPNINSIKYDSNILIERIIQLKQLDNFIQRLVRIGRKDLANEIELKYPYLIIEIKNIELSDFDYNFYQMNNDQLAHHVLFDPHYRLKYDDEMKLDTKNAMKNAFWESVIQDLTSLPPKFGRVLRILCQVRNGISVILPEISKNKLDEIIDENFIQDQVDHGVYEWKNFINLLHNIVFIIHSVQIPQQQTKLMEEWTVIKKTFDETDLSIDYKIICNGLKFILNQTNIARIDYGNFKLKKIILNIKDNGIKYEREIFDEKLKNGDLTLDKTHKWLHDAILKHPDILENVANNNKGAQKIVFGYALAKLASEYNGFNCPETLLLDLNNLIILSTNFNKMLLFSKIILVIRQVLTNYHCSKDIINNAIVIVTEELLKLDTSMYSEIDIYVTEAVISVTKPAYYDTIFRTIKSLLVISEDTLSILLKNRLFKIYQHAIVGEEELLVQLLGKGLETIWSKVQESIKILRRISLINLQVHEERYSIILQKEAAQILNAV